MTAAAMWPGPYRHEAVLAFRRAVTSGMTPLRGLVVGCVASYRDCWMFQSRIAQMLGCSVRTVQRALRQARDLGLIRCHRSKRNERAPGLGEVVPCGWSHRWAVGWGMGTQAAALAVQVARVTRLVPGMFRRRRRPSPPEAVARRWTAEEIDDELARRRAQGPPE